MNSGLFKNATYKMGLEIICLIFMYKKDLHQVTYNGWYVIKSNRTKSYIFNIYV